MPQEIKLFGLGQQSKSPNITAMHRLNVYYDIQADPDKTSVAAYGTPGTVLFSSVSSQPSRGMHWMESNNVLYVVQRGDLWAVASNGIATLKKSLTTINPTDINGRVSMANNGTELCIVTGTYGYIYNTATDTLTSITASLPAGGSDTVTFLDSYFIVNRANTGQFYISGQYDGLTWNALNFATAESNPDNLMAVMSDKGYLALFGTSSTEIWVNTGELAFPFSRVNGSPSPSGLAARWSLTRCGEYITGLFKNKHGALFVGQLQGYQIVQISTPDIDYLFNKLTAPSDAVAFGYTLNGRVFYQISFQTDAQTWLYDVTANAWSQLSSWGKTRHIADLGAAFAQKFVVSDYQSGSLYYLSADAFTDNGLPIVREITGGHLFTSGRNKVRVRRLRIDMEGGVGDNSTQGNNPTVMLQISRNGGHTWGMEQWTTIGELGHFHRRAEWRRLGISRDYVFKIRMTDPVKFVLMQAVVEADECNK